MPYNYLSKAALCKLPVSKIAAGDCLLFMWTTGPKLNTAFEVGAAWGFVYSTIAFVWEKEITNPGYYTLSSTEVCLVFKKGKIPTPRGARNIRQFLSQRRKEHSRKPDTIRNRITRMFPTQRKIEIFARQKTPGWDAIGYDVDGLDITESLRKL